MGPLAQIASLPVGWEAGTEVAVGTGGSTSAVDLGSYLHQTVLLFWLPDSKGSGHSCHIRWGDDSVGAATLSDLPLTEEHPSRRVLITRDYTHLRAIAAGGIGSLFIAPQVA